MSPDGVEMRGAELTDEPVAVRSVVLWVVGVEIRTAAQTGTTAEITLPAASRGWMVGYFAPHPPLDVPLEQLEQATGALHERLRGNYPFFHPRCIGQTPCRRIQWESG